MPWPMVVGALLAAAPAAVEPPCGPATAETLATTRDARVYVVSAQAVGCHRRSSPVRLGVRSRVRGVRLAGRFAAVRRQGVTGVGEQLSVYDLRRGVRIGGASFDGSGDERGVARFTRIRLARSGVAAYIADYGPQGDRVVQDTDGGFYARDARLDPGFLRLAGSTVAWRVGSTYELSALDGERQTSSGTLLRLGRVRVEAVVSGFRIELRARLGRRRGVPLGEPTSVCVGSSGCSGIEALQRAGRFVATRYFAYSIGDESGWLTIHDLRTGQGRTMCRRWYRGYVGAFVLTRRGTAACGMSGRSEDPPYEHEIRAEGRVLDRGPRIDPNSLHRRGDRLVWVHDGVERTAPLP